VTTGGPTATLSGPKGTIGWMSPERINTSLRLAPPTDVYSFGVLCYVVRLFSYLWSNIAVHSLLTQMWTRERPFSNMNDFKVVMHVSGGGRLERPSSQECHGEAFPDVLWDLVCHCWGQTAGTRPRMSTIVASFESWIRGTVETSDIHRSEGADLDVDRRAAHSI
jgi:serine/threonine protein kinase